MFSLGSIHSNTWTGQAADLAAREFLAVHPTYGWVEPPTKSQGLRKGLQIFSHCIDHHADDRHLHAGRGRNWYADRGRGLVSPYTIMDVSLSNAGPHRCAGHYNSGEDRSGWSSPNFNQTESPPTK
jgi:hypothetical protein